MLVLIAGLLIFLGIHSIRLFADDWRSRQIARLGAGRWKGLYTVASLVGFALIVIGFGAARAAPIVLWHPPRSMAHLAALLTLIAFILVVAAYIPGSHLKARVGHPMLAGTKAWALGHLLANGSLADVLLFGGFFAWSIADFIASRRRDRANGVQYVALGWQRDLAAVVVGAIIWVAFLHWGHAWLIGVNPEAML